MLAAPPIPGVQVVTDTVKAAWPALHPWQCFDCKRLLPRSVQDNWCADCVLAAYQRVEAASPAASRSGQAEAILGSLWLAFLARGGTFGQFYGLDNVPQTYEPAGDGGTL
jgi:hypothetical protein